MGATVFRPDGFSSELKKGNSGHSVRSTTVAPAYSAAVCNLLPPESARHPAWVAGRLLPEDRKSFAHEYFARGPLHRPATRSPGGGPTVV
jgi:hypothetical protein